MSSSISGILLDIFGACAVGVLLGNTESVLRSLSLRTGCFAVALGPAFLLWVENLLAKKWDKRGISWACFIMNFRAAP